MIDKWVLDASVLIQAYIEDSESARAQTLVAHLENSDPPEIHFPEMGLAECTNVLWKRVRFFGTAVEQVETALENLLTLPLALHQISPLLPRALKIGLMHQLPIYDSVYIALAEALGCALITVDRKQAQIANTVGITLKPITDFPPIES